MRIRGINGELIKPLGLTNKICLKIFDKDITTDFIVVNEAAFPGDLLLSFTFLEENHVAINFGSKEVSVCASDANETPVVESSVLSELCTNEEFPSELSDFNGECCHETYHKGLEDIMSVVRAICVVSLKEGLGEGDSRPKSPSQDSFQDGRPVSKQGEFKFVKSDRTVKMNTQCKTINEAATSTSLTAITDYTRSYRKEDPMHNSCKGGSSQVLITGIA